MTVLIHVANVLFLLSYLVKDILWLRSLTVVAGLTLLAYYFSQPAPVWAAIGWNVLFLGINVWQVHVLLRERRPVALAPEEHDLYERAFRSLTRREYVKLLRAGTWESVPAGTCIVKVGQELDRVRVLASGAARVEVAGRTVVALGPGQFIGEMSFVTGERPSADVSTTDAVRLVSWPKEHLRRMLGENADLRAAVQRVIGADLVAKLRADSTGAAAASGNA